MSFVIAAPEALVAAASDLTGIGSTLDAAHAAAALPTTGVLAAAADEVSEQIAALFSQHGQGYQQLSAQAAAFHTQFVHTLTAGANQYAAAETGAAQTLANTVNGAAQKVLGQPLFGGGAGGGSIGGIGSRLLGGTGLFGGSGLLGSSAGTAPSLGASAALALRPTGGLGALSAAVSPLLRASGLTGGVVAPAAFEGIANAIKSGYDFIEPIVEYGFDLAAYAVGWVPWVGILAPQITFFYDLFEPMVHSLVFNGLDWITGAISFGTGLSNLVGESWASFVNFINTEINWFLGFLPPLPPWPF